MRKQIDEDAASRVSRARLDCRSPNQAPLRRFRRASIDVLDVMMRRSIMKGGAAAGALMLAYGATAQSSMPARAVYVSPRGSDENSGVSPDKPFRTLERAQRELVAKGISDVYLLDGIFSRNAQLNLRTLPQPQRWMAYPNTNPILDGNGKVGAAIYIAANNVTIKGITIRHFSENGIVMKGSRNVSILSNAFENIYSGTWTKAAILGIQFVENIRIIGNNISDTGYAGIGFFSSKDGVLRNILVADNRVSRTCRAIADCGAIYLSGRSLSSDGNTVRGNVIFDYGPAGSDARGIYLDDYLSKSRIENNHISGCGRYGIHIHGGHDNIITANVIREGSNQAAIFYQSVVEASRGAMTGNILSRNTIATAKPDGWIAYDGASIRPRLIDNQVRPAIATCGR